MFAFSGIACHGTFGLGKGIVGGRLVVAVAVGHVGQLIQIEVDQIQAGQIKFSERYVGRSFVVGRGWRVGR